MADSTESNQELLHEEIVIFEHMTPSQMGDVMEKIAAVTNKMIGLALAGGAFGVAGAASQLAQPILQVAMHSGAAAAMLKQAAQQALGIGMMPSPPQPRRMN